MTLPSAPLLLVDDRPENLLALEGVLAPCGVEVISVSSGPEALEQLRLRDFAAILLDVQKPGMDGLETAARIRKQERLARTPILFLTAVYDDESHRRRAYELGAVDYLRKPLDVDVLRAKVSALVGAFQRGRLESAAGLEALRQREAELTDFLENAVVGLHWVAEDGTILWANQAELDLLGYTREEYIGHPIWDFHADPAAIGDILDRLRNHETLHSYEAQLRCKDGSVRHVLISSNVRWDGERFLHTRCLTRDITARVVAEREARFRAELLDMVEQAVIATDLSGRITYWNRCAGALYGWDADEVLGRSILEVTPSPESTEQAGAIMERLRSGSSWSGEFTGRRRDGTTFPAWVVDAPMRDERGEMIGVVGVSSDISELKALQASLQARMHQLEEVDRRKDSFLAMLGHELRNPLAAISSALQVLRTAPPGSAPFHRSLDAALRQVEHQTRIVHDLLDVTRITQGKVELRSEWVDLARVVSDFAEDHRPQLDSAGLHFRVLVPENPVPVAGDPTRLVQLLENLLDNARKFTPRGGEVTVSLTELSQHAVLRVTDTGVGIDSETRRHLFQPFTQADRSLERSPGGLGLGLCLVKNIVELHGGEVAVHSEAPGRGAEFEITLPLARVPPPSAPATETPSRPEAELPGLRVLVVEDHPDAAETLRDLLELSGHTVEVLPNGARCVERARSFRAEVVLCDIGLPGMSGYEVAAALRRCPDTAGLRLIALTGYGSAEDRARSEAAGFDLHLTKPVAPEALGDALAGVSKASQASSAVTERPESGGALLLD